MQFTLRDLPLPVKVVATVFLLAVGAGYGSAMVQLHMQDSKSGQPMPTVADVIRKYTGKVKFDPANAPPPPVSQLEALIMGPIEGQPWNGTGSMAPAFFHKDPAYKKLIEAKPAEKARIDAEREGERAVSKWWIALSPDARKTAYDTDRCDIGADRAPAAITPEFKNADGTYKIKSLLDARCARCHAPGEAQDKYPLSKYEEFEKYLTVPVQPQPVNGYIKVSEPIDVSKLTQSTHAHLLSFAVLFSLTGVIFACSSYPTGMRVILGPWVVIAVFTDVSLWWLARLCDEWGPFFAMGIIATGGAAGMGLGAQITLSVFNMYGRKGKLMLAVMFGAGAGLAGFLFVNKIQPILAAKQNAAQNPPAANGKDVAKKPNDDKKVLPPKAHVPTSDLDRLLTLPPLDSNLKPITGEVSFNGGDTGNMAAALFEKDKVYKNVMEGGPQADKDKLKSQREAELAALQAWVRAPDAARKAAYTADALDAPELASKVDPMFAKGSKVLVKSLLDTRCASCHGPERKQEDYPLTKYEEFEKYLKPLATNANGAAPIPRAADK
jgi:mono/diheme cytochrome c family protein